ncbi:hypothetical protein TorRG33x02_254140 [Trema orientale]|uniref:Uncharacterized protein n=1 Tax=Trema orientale TaxID=63057 RepID=A0A2P5DEB4_TREOI|nr:hypothetical protein TorRG33x02_254140 [Trema orientale]
MKYFQLLWTSLAQRSRTFVVLSLTSMTRLSNQRKRTSNDRHRLSRPIWV